MAESGAQAQRPQRDAERHRPDGGNIGDVRVSICPTMVPCPCGADAFYEWKAVEGGKQPYAIARVDGQPMAFAGLWEGFRRPDGTVAGTFTIITTNANPTMADLHDRIPAILGPNDWRGWLGETSDESKTLLRPAGDDVLRVWPVSQAVNLPRNNGPELLAAVG